MSWITDCLTGLDGQTYDVGRISGVTIMLSGLGLSAYDVVWRGHPFSFQDFGVGAGALCAGIGALLKLKENSEPGSPSVRAEDRADRQEARP